MTVTEDMVTEVLCPLPKDEYRNETDGLLYCTKCHTPRQRKLQLPGKAFFPRIPCQCQQERDRRLHTRRQQQRRLEEISLLKRNGLQDSFLHGCTFANDGGYCPELEKARKYVERWKEWKEKSMGLLLWGNVGTGKTFFAGCIANALLEQGIPVLMTNFPRILNTLSGFYPGERNRFIDDLSRYDLLIVDDLGIERNSEYALEQVFQVVDSRYRSRLPLIVTTNLTLQELKYPPDLAHARIYDRILECCVPVKINGQNIRQIKRDEHLLEARSLLEQ